MIQFSKFSVLVLLLTLVVPISTQPANAIFGLSKCEKVKKEVLTQEKQITDGLSFWWKFRSQTLPDYMVSRFTSDLKRIEGMYQERLKFLYNNSKCFSRTQNEYIATRWKNSSIYELVVFKTRLVFYQDKICKNESKKAFWEKVKEECIKNMVYDIEWIYSLDSIYSH